MMNAIHIFVLITQLYFIMGQVSDISKKEYNFAKFKSVNYTGTDGTLTLDYTTF